jgi:hypothetical protein
MKIVSSDHAFYWAETRAVGRRLNREKAVEVGVKSMHAKVARESVWCDKNGQFALQSMRKEWKVFAMNIFRGLLLLFFPFFCTAASESAIRASSSSAFDTCL